MDEIYDPEPMTCKQVADKLMETPNELVNVHMVVLGRMFYMQIRHVENHMIDLEFPFDSQGLEE